MREILICPTPEGGVLDAGLARGSWLLAVGQKGPGRVESGPFWMIQDFPP
jgi:hypothetical protein